MRISFFCLSATPCAATAEGDELQATEAPAPAPLTPQMRGTVATPAETADDDSSDKEETVEGKDDEAQGDPSAVSPSVPVPVPVPASTPLPQGQSPSPPTPPKARSAVPGAGQAGAAGGTPTSSTTAAPPSNAGTAPEALLTASVAVATGTLALLALS
ncbi:hypothetical protein Emag_007753 [Eimeria magna]